MVSITPLPVSVNPTDLDSVRPHPKSKSLRNTGKVWKISEANSNPGEKEVSDIHTRGMDSWISRLLLVIIPRLSSL